MDINRNNYEVFLIDYMDGNLSTLQMKAVDAFLLLNPDLYSEFENLNNHILIPQSLSYKDKLLLKKSDYSLSGINNEFDYLCVASVENDINCLENQKLNRLMIDNNSFRIEYDHFYKAKLKPNPEIKFQHKTKLKRFTIFGFNRVQLVSFSSATALLLLLFGLFNFFSGDFNSSNNSSLVQEIEGPSTNYFPELPYEVVPPNIEFTNKEPDVVSAPIQDLQKSNGDESKPEPPLIYEDVKRVSIDYLKPRKLSSITVKSKDSEIILPPLHPEESFVNAVQIAQSTDRTVGLYDLVQFGVNLLGKASGTELKLEGSRDTTGKLKRIQLESDFFALSIPVNRKK